MHSEMKLTKLRSSNEPLTVVFLSLQHCDRLYKCTDICHTYGDCGVKSHEHRLAQSCSMHIHVHTIQLMMTHDGITQSL